MTNSVFHSSWLDEGKSISLVAKESNDLCPFLFYETVPYMWNMGSYPGCEQVFYVNVHTTVGLHLWFLGVLSIFSCKGLKALGLLWDALAISI